jgi:penicillin-binding protein 1C
MTPSALRAGPFRIAAVLLGTAALSVAAAALLRPAPRFGVPESTLVTDRLGEPLRLTLAADGQYRLWTSLEEFDPLLVEAVLFKEDRGFWMHPGVDFPALANAAWHSLVLRDYRAGASTIPMQAARLLWRLDTDTIPGKAVQAAAALGLSALRSKREILELYLNLAPCGGNVQGLGTASRVFFGKAPAALNAAEALALAVLPQDPARRNPAAAGTEGGEGTAYRAIIDARDRLFFQMAERRSDLAARGVEIDMPLSFRRELPFEAPHLVDSLLRAQGSAPVPRLRSTIDLGVQRLLERTVASFAERGAASGVENAAALLARSDTMEVLSSVGSADFFSDRIDGQVDGTAAYRSPGSTLKPFIYALALQQGLIHPLSVLKDARLHFGGYNPDNFDDDFEGPIRATDALTKSRNVPAVYLASRIENPDLYEFLRRAGVALPFGRDHYGLSIVLGGAEVRMRDLVYLYGALAGDGERAGATRPLRYLADAAPEPSRRLLDARAAYLVRRMLETKPRPDAGEGWDSASLGSAESADRPVAYKTGTSIGFRDAWSVGIFDGMILAVWVGDFRGRSNPEFLGLGTAAPLLFELVDALRSTGAAARIAGGATGSGAETAGGGGAAPEGIVRVPVCAVSGEIATELCPRTVESLFIAGVSPIGACTVHRAYHVDRITGLRRARELPGATERRVYEVWPADVMALFSQAGLARVSPPPPDPSDASYPSGLFGAGVSDAEGFSGGGPAIVSPVRGISYLVDPRSAEDRIPLVSAALSDARTVWWFVDDAVVGSVPPGTPLFWPPAPGTHVVRAVDDQGRAAETTLRVEFRE